MNDEAVRKELMKSVISLTKKLQIYPDNSHSNVLLYAFSQQSLFKNISQKKREEIINLMLFVFKKDLPDYVNQFSRICPDEYLFKETYPYLMQDKAKAKIALSKQIEHHSYILNNLINRHRGLRSRNKVKDITGYQKNAHDSAHALYEKIMLEQFVLTPKDQKSSGTTRI